MRKLLISLLLAAAAASPALAEGDPQQQSSDDSDDSRSQAREQRQQQREQARSERQESREQARSQRPERSVEFRARVNDGPARAEAIGRADRRDVEAIREAREPGVVRRDIEEVRAAREARRRQVETVEPARIDRVVRINRGGAFEGSRDTTDTVRNWRSGERQRIARRDATGGPKIVTPGEAGALRQSERPLPRVLRNRIPLVSNTPREGTQPPLRAERRRHERVSWSSHWRSNHRYDWHHWRSRHRSLFRLGLYIDPFGWGYRPYSIGWRLWPSYYRSRFWLDDPWQYRLPYAPPGYRWIRYYDDALLVDTWNGEVVDVIYNFFW
jgi:hypothetical protein